VRLLYVALWLVPNDATALETKVGFAARHGEAALDVGDVVALDPTDRVGAADAIGEGTRERLLRLEPQLVPRGADLRVARGHLAEPV